MGRRFPQQVSSLEVLRRHIQAWDEIPQEKNRSSYPGHAPAS
jgi:hypothetical protein